MERMHGRGGVYGGGVFLISGRQIEGQKITKIKYNKGLRWPPFNILHATTNQKHAGMTEGGWDRPHNRASTLGEHDGNDNPLAEGDNNDDKDEYNKDGDIFNDNNGYAIGLMVSTSPLTRVTRSMILSAPPLCPQSQQPSVLSR